MNMFGFDKRSFTLWKKFFSASIRVDSALATRMKTSASRQYLLVVSESYHSVGHHDSLEHVSSSRCVAVRKRYCCHSHRLAGAQAMTITQLFTGPIRAFGNVIYHSSHDYQSSHTYQSNDLDQNWHRFPGCRARRGHPSTEHIFVWARIPV